MKDDRTFLEMSLYQSGGPPETEILQYVIIIQG